MQHSGRQHVDRHHGLWCSVGDYRCRAFFSELFIHITLLAVPLRSEKGSRNEALMKNEDSQTLAELNVQEGDAVIVVPDFSFV